MPIRYLARILLILGLGLVSTTAWADKLSLMLGTGGAGLDWTTPVSNRLQTRFHFSYFRYHYDSDYEGVKYQVKFDNVKGGILLDWHPFASRYILGGIRTSAGMLTSNFGLGLRAKSQESYEIGGETYTGDIHLAGQLNFNRVAPYLGLGWGTAPSRRGIRLVGDIGVLYIGKPSLTLTAKGTAQASHLNNGQAFDVGSYAQFQDDLETERQNVEGELKIFSFFPLVNLGISVGF